MTEAKRIIHYRSLSAHMIAHHGFNNDTVSIWSESELSAQHDNHHADEGYDDHGHKVVTFR